MKKCVLICMLSVSAVTATYAQNDVELGVFNHMSLGVGIGTTGISVDAAAPLSQYVAVRAGANIFPNIKIKENVDLHFDSQAQMAYNTMFPGSSLPNKIEIEGKPKFTTGHLLFDFYPFTGSSFHLTAGAYMGSSAIAEVYNRGDKTTMANIYQYNNSSERQQYGVDKIGVELGDYFLEPDAAGDVKARLKVSAFRPYVGIGFGRAVPAKHRVTCNFDMGVQFWGKPKVYMVGASGEKELTKSDLNGKDGDVLKYISKASIWPVLNVRVVCRLF